jgi:hypothetical protein
MSLPADVTAFGHPGGEGMDMAGLAASLQGNPMLQQAMADNPEMAELLNNPAALQEKMAAAQARHSAPRCTPALPRPGLTQRAPLPACTARPARASLNARVSGLGRSLLPHVAHARGSAWAPSSHLAEHRRTAAPPHRERFTSQAEMQQLMNSDEGREASAKIMAAPPVTRVAGCSRGWLQPWLVAAVAGCSRGWLQPWPAGCSLGRIGETVGAAGLEVACAPPDLGCQIRPGPPGCHVATVHPTIICPARGGVAW